MMGHARIPTEEPDLPPPRWPGWVTLAGVGLLYVVGLVIATYPAAWTFGSRLAVSDLTDPIQHLWILRWYRSCLESGRSPLFCPDLQYPVGSPLGLYSPLQLQTLIFLVCSVFTSNDVLIYNLILAFEFLFTGLATFALAWFLVRHRAGAMLAGLLAMLSGPMLFNAAGGGTELMALGGFPLFLIGWMRFVDRPTRGRLAAAVGLFLLLASCAAYYGVLGIFPAVLYVVVRAWKMGWRGVGDWVRRRIRWGLAFAGLTAMAIPLLFPAQVWSAAHGYSLARSKAHFLQFGTTLWHYVVPGPSYRFAALWMPPFWQAQGFAAKCPVYLGVVTLGLLGYAAAMRVRFRRSQFLWLSLGMLVVLSMGAYGSIGPKQIPLPALWLWEWFPPFRSLRVPARFGYLGVVCAAVLASGR